MALRERRFRRTRLDQGKRPVPAGHPGGHLKCSVSVRLSGQAQTLDQTCPGRRFDASGGPTRPGERRHSPKWPTFSPLGAERGGSRANTALETSIDSPTTLTAKPTPALDLGPLPSPRAPSGDTDRSSRLRAGQAEPEGLTSESSRHSLTPKSCQRPHGPLGCTHRISVRHALDSWDHQPSTRAWLPVVSTGEGGLLLQEEPRCPQLAVRLSPGGGWRERLD